MANQEKNDESEGSNSKEDETDLHLLSETRLAEAKQQYRDKEDDDDSGDHVDGDVTQRYKPPDGGWGWMVVLGSWLMHFLLGGYSRSYGVTYIKLREKFDSSAAITSWVGGINVGFRFFGGPIATALMNKFSARKVVIVGGFIMGVSSVICALAPNIYFMFFSYSIGTGFGGTLIYSPGLVLISHYFDKRRGIATGLASSGSGLGAFVFPLFMQFLFDYYGFFGAFLILGAVVFNNCVSGALYRPLPVKPTANSGAGKSNPEDTENNVDDTEKTTEINKRKKCVPTCQCKSFIDWMNKHFGLHNFKNFGFTCYCISLTLLTVAYIACHSLVIDMAREKGIPDTQAVFLFSIIGISDTVGRLLSGFLYDSSCIRPNRVHVYSITMALSGLFMYALVYSPTYPMLVTCAVFHGLFNGSVVSQKAVVLVDIVGIEEMSSCFGLCVGSQGIGVFVGPLFAGLLRDIYGEYLPSFLFAGSCCICGAVVLALSNIYTYLHHKHKDKDVIELDVSV